MHHQVGVGNGLVDFSDAADCQHFTGGFAGELVGPMAGADCDCQSIAFCFCHKIRCLSWIGQQHVLGQLAFEAMAVFRFAFSCFQ